jgi:hypothetical protein
MTTDITISPEIPLYNYFTITYGNSKITSSSSNLIKSLAWPATCYTTPLSKTNGTATIINYSNMCYSYSYQLSNANFQGVASSNSSASPISFGDTSSTFCFDATYRSGGAFGTNATLLTYSITAANLGPPATTFTGAFVYITFNNYVLNL